MTARKNCQIPDSISDASSLYPSPPSPHHERHALTGTKEIAGAADNPLIMAMLRTDSGWPAHDEVPWCSAVMNFIAKLWRLPRSKSLAARSWLQVGEPISLDQAEPGFDVVILKRGRGDQPGPEVLDASGHVGWFAGLDGERVLLLGGNQGDSITIAPFPVRDVLGVRRLA